MKKDLSAFIDSGATLKFGPDKWNDAKKSLLKSNNDLIIITSKSCKKFISDIPSKYILVIKTIWVILDFGNQIIMINIDG